MAAKRRLAPTIVIPTLLMGLAGFLFSYFFTPKYTAQSTVLIEAQKVPESMVQPVVLEDLAARVSTLQNQSLAESRLKPLVEKLYPGKSPEEIGEMIDDIRQNMQVEAVPSELLAIGTTETTTKPGTSPFPGFNVKFTAPNAREAQQICNELTDLMVREYANQINDAAAGTSEVLTRAIEDAESQLTYLQGKLRNVEKSRVKSADSDGQKELLSLKYDFARKNYQSLLEKKAQADLTVKMNNQSVGERMVPLILADLPDAAEFPNRFIFVGVGLGIGLTLGVGLAIWARLRGKNTQSETEPLDFP